MKRILPWSVCWLALASVAPAQSAGFSTYGTACSVPGAPAPSIGNAGLPVLGTTFAITYAGPNAIEPGLGLTDRPILLVGAGRLDVPVPIFEPTQPAGCRLLVAPDVLLPMAPDASGRRFEDRVAVPVPNDPVLLGGIVRLQWMVPHEQCFFVGCGLGWIVFSEGAEALVGT